MPNFTVLQRSSLCRLLYYSVSSIYCCQQDFKKCPILSVSFTMIIHKGRPGSSVGIATEYGLEGPGIESSLLRAVEQVGCSSEVAFLPAEKGRD